MQHSQTCTAVHDTIFHYISGRGYTNMVQGVTGDHRDACCKGRPQDQHNISSHHQERNQSNALTFLHSLISIERQVEVTCR